MLVPLAEATVSVEETNEDDPASVVVAACVGTTARLVPDAPDEGAEESLAALELAEVVSGAVEEEAATVESVGTGATIRVVPDADAAAEVDSAEDAVELPIDVGATMRVVPAADEESTEAAEADASPEPVGATTSVVPLAPGSEDAALG